MEVQIHDLESAPEQSKLILEDVRSRFGFVPHLIGVMAESPSLLKAYLSLQKLFGETSLSAAEQQVVLLETSVTNGCEYCVAAHTMIAGQQGVPAIIVEAIRQGDVIADHRLEALRELAREITALRGWPSEQAIGCFVEAGYGPQQVFEVILGVTMKTLSNYTNHVASTPLDEPFAAGAWQASAREA